ncbi:hypothetical protein WR25_24592 [Diploscapter pachys]|uniref:Ubiquitin-like domain-containing protein n=1 Tax=Diploscapter pachys TaxID=2018661 RepID=A0A2A2JC25_9BILA|nr:hypothetical protein WR25_24592 [Diploscapter pachys]
MLSVAHPPQPANGQQLVSSREEDSMNTEASMSGKTIIGLIYPPPDIRTIVDKTANFVARNGADFERKIREKESANARFDFLKPEHPYHAYYKKKVQDFEEGKAELPKTQAPEAVKQLVKKADEIPTRPPMPFEFTADPSTINAQDLDIIKLTAMFVARNGRQFLTQLMTREARNSQFDFLKPAHSNFSYFTKLVEQYTKVIIPSNSVVDELAADLGNTKKLLDDVDYRVRWEKHQKQLKDKEEQQLQQERLAYAQIDWHDFVVVQTVDFQPGDTSNLPPLCTPRDVGARILLEQRAEQQRVAAEAEEMDVGDSDSEGEEEIQNEVPQELEKTTPAPPPFVPPLPPTKQGNVIVRDYDPKKAAHKASRPTDKWIISPLTGERIPAEKLEEHIRYNTMDSQYKEDRERFQEEKKNEEPVLAHGGDISKHLGKFAERRSDIFGVGAAGAEQTIIGQKLGEEEPTPNLSKQPIWDGTEETREAVTRLAQQQVTLDQQIHEIHRQHGFVPDPSKERVGAQLPQTSQMQTRSQARQAETRPPPPSNLEPPSKRQKTEDELVPESEWAQKVSGQVDLRVALPQADEAGLDGSIIALTTDITSTIADLKTKLQDKFNLPISKQKLVFDGFFLKDNCTCAYYNMNNHSLISLQLKERGGKRKKNMLRLIVRPVIRQSSILRCSQIPRCYSKHPGPDDDLRKDMEKLMDSLKGELKDLKSIDAQKQTDFENKNEPKLDKDFMGFSRLREKQAHDRSAIFNWKVTSVTLTAIGVLLAFLLYLRKKREEEKENKRRQIAGKARIGGPWELVNMGGKPEGSQDLIGNWLLIYFGFTHCPDICPDEIEKMIKVVDLIESDTSYSHIPLKPIFISVDPERDTIERVKKYCSEFSPKLKGYTGSKEQVDKVTKTFRVYYSQGPREKNAPDDYIVDHTVIMYLIDPEGNFHDYYGQNRKADEIANIIKLKMTKFMVNKERKSSVLGSLFTKD